VRPSAGPGPAVEKSDKDRWAVGERLCAELSGVSADRVVILCVGNADRGDDGFGPAVAARLRGRLCVPVFDAGTVPENDLPRIASRRPELVVIVDAVHWGGAPGELRWLDPAGLREDDVSTHCASLATVVEFLEVSCGARVRVLAAQPAQTGLGKGLSEKMRSAAETCARILQRLLGPPDEGGVGGDGGPTR